MRGTEPRRTAAMRADSKVASTVVRRRITRRHRTMLRPRIMHPVHLMAAVLRRITPPRADRRPVVRHRMALLRRVGQRREAVRPRIAALRRVDRKREAVRPRTAALRRADRRREAVRPRTAVLPWVDRRRAAARRPIAAVRRADRKRVLQQADPDPPVPRQVAVGDPVELPRAAQPDPPRQAAARGPAVLVAVRHIPQRRPALRRLHRRRSNVGKQKGRVLRHSPFFAFMEVNQLWAARRLSQPTLVVLPGGPPRKGGCRHNWRPHQGLRK
jgi:hypothetical protein